MTKLSVRIIKVYEKNIETFSRNWAPPYKKINAAEIGITAQLTRFWLFWPIGEGDFFTHTI
jgi:hypothetical protein